MNDDVERLKAENERLWSEVRRQDRILRAFGLVNVTTNALRVIELRRALGINQSEMARRLGVSQSLVSQIERGDQAPQPDLMARLGRLS